MPVLLTGSVAWFYHGPRTSTLFRIHFRVTLRSHTDMPSTPSSPAAAAPATPTSQRNLSLHFAVPTAEEKRPSLLHGGDPILSTNCPQLQSTSRRRQLHSLLGSRKNCVGDRLRSDTHLRAESRGQPCNKKRNKKEKRVWQAETRRNGAAANRPSVLVVSDKENGG